MILAVATHGPSLVGLRSARVSDGLRGVRR